jgi:peptidyl-prolyl cis-trans isomerase D
MSIIQSIRDKGAWIVGAVIAIALISFILQDGLNRRGSVLDSSSNIGKVNGVTIDKDEFYAKVENATKNNSSQRDQVVNQLFEQEVGKILLEQEFEKTGVACSDKELNEEMFKPTSQLVQQFKDPKTGLPDVEQAKKLV